MILVVGGTGFVGTHVVHALRATELPVRALARRPEKQDQLRSWGCEVVQGDMTDPESLKRAVEGCTTVVHLVALPPFADAGAIERVMVQGTRDLVEASKEAGVTRIVLQSALGTEEGREPYYNAKWEEEQAVKYSGIEHVIFRPSFIFGRDGGLLVQQIKIVRFSPLTPILSRHRMQPIWVDDIASFFTAAVSSAEAPNRTYDLGGPDRVTWAGLHEQIRETLGKRRLTFRMPAGLLKAGATMGQILPPLRGARSAVEMLDHGDNVCDPQPAIEAYGVRPIGVEEQVRRAVAG
jgi:NADH dehydrogenase